MHMSSAHPAVAGFSINLTLSGLSLVNPILGTGMTYTGALPYADSNLAALCKVYPTHATYTHHTI